MCGVRLPPGFSFLVSILFGFLNRYLPVPVCAPIRGRQFFGLCLDEVTWTTKNWHGLQMQRLSVVLHAAVAWQTVNELACGESGIVHGAKCIAVLNGVA